MYKYIIIFLFISIYSYAEHDTILKINTTDSIKDSNYVDVIYKISYTNDTATDNDSLVLIRLKNLNNISHISFSYNDIVKSSIKSYSGNNKRLISRMLSLSEYYFPIFEECLDKYDLPLELKYLSIVESALNPEARSKSGARGLWQFMYPTGKENGLDVNSYIDERLDPYKSTEAACQYFVKLYDIFGDWHLVLAAYNGGPGYIQRKMISTGKDNYWDLRPYLRRETRNYIPKFIAVSYLMTYPQTYDILPDSLYIKKYETDTFKLNCQQNFSLLSYITCIPEEDIQYLNPSFKNNFFPENAIITLPIEAVNDYLLNIESNTLYIDAVNRKEILIDETRFVYSVKNGDYLGKIASIFGLKTHQIQKWNRLKSTKLNIGDKLTLYVANDILEKNNNLQASENEYIVQKGDTLWDISQMYNGVSISKIKQLNNLKSNNLKPGLRIVIPKV
ncbi:MAG: LysM peptidoglycan-binding domain-containing protein [Flavobacteriales bacterium]|jgi:membrane-bound lytic murein transglycosylase D|nr:LysM peptidoglycan-binding domain-containing protein [Flavobacteriales bacterium]